MFLLIVDLLLLGSSDNEVGTGALGVIKVNEIPIIAINLCFLNRLVLKKLGDFGRISPKIVHVCRGRAHDAVLAGHCLLLVVNASVHSARRFGNCWS